MESLSSRVPASNEPKGIDIGKMVSESQKTLSTEKTKRVRRTKAELEAARGSGREPLRDSNAIQNSSGAVGIPQPPRDRTKELTPTFKLFSKSLLADPLECPGIALNDDESEALARVTSDLMNVFPEYFNQADPKVAAIVSAAFVAGPLIYMKYRIYQDFKKEKINQSKNVVSTN